MSDLDLIVKEFLVESYENLDQLDRDLVALEKDPGDRERLASVFRTIHTVKGTCGFFNFSNLGALTHAGESLLSQLRDGKLRLTPTITSALLALVDAVRRTLGRIERTGQEGDEDHAELIALFRAVASGQWPVASEEEKKRSEAETKAAQVDEESSSLTTDHWPLTTAERGTLRVDVGLLDRLMTLVGELVLARNQMLQLAATQQDTALQQASQRLNLITSELQEGVMKTRMQPIGNIWKTLPRVARDVSLACGKTVHVELLGEETELDKTILEALKDPLTHLVRNAIDHGIETADVRQARGKPAAGRLLLRAFHEGGQVNLEIADDGGGIDADRVKRKALERGLLTAARATHLGDRDLLQLVFLPGFSAAEQVTAVSGRGVGMDVVKTNIERIGGTVDLQSRPGQGTPRSRSRSRSPWPSSRR